MKQVTMSLSAPYGIKAGKLLNLKNPLHPVVINKSTDWKAVTAGKYHKALIKEDGTLWTSGENYFGQLGTGDLPIKEQTQPVQVGSETDWAVIEAGFNHTLAIKSNNSLWGFGANSRGQLGTSNKINYFTPVKIGEGFSKAASASHSLLIDINKTLWGFGNNENGQLGTGKGTKDKILSPIQINSERIWESVAVASRHSLALTVDGELYVAGENESGQLGMDKSIEQVFMFMPITSKIPWVKISAGETHSVAIKEDGTLWGFGKGSGIDSFTPILLSESKDWADVSAGLFYSLALKKNGSLYMFGKQSMYWIEERHCIEIAV